MFTEDKITEIFCIADDFCNFFDAQMTKRVQNGAYYGRNSPFSGVLFVRDEDCCSPKSRAFSLLNAHLMDLKRKNVNVMRRHGWLSHAVSVKHYEAVWC